MYLTFLTHECLKDKHKQPNNESTQIKSVPDHINLNSYKLIRPSRNGENSQSGIFYSILLGFVSLIGLFFIFGLPNKNTVKILGNGRNLSDMDIEIKDFSRSVNSKSYSVVIHTVLLHYDIKVGNNLVGWPH